MRREPIFNVPRLSCATLAVLVLVHVRARMGADGAAGRTTAALVRVHSGALRRVGDWPMAGAVAGLVAQIWTFVTYALIHGDWTHLGLNGVWLLAFGTPIARRFGTARFLRFFARDGGRRRGSASCHHTAMPLSR